MQVVANKDNCGRQLTRDETRKIHSKMKSPNLRIRVEMQAAIIGITTTTLTVWEAIMLMGIKVILILLIIIAAITTITVATLVAT